MAKLLYLLGQSRIKKTMFGKPFGISLHQFHYLQFYSQKFTFRQYFNMFKFLNTSVKILLLLRTVCKTNTANLRLKDY